MIGRAKFDDRVKISVENYCNFFANVFSRGTVHNKVELISSVYLYESMPLSSAQLSLLISVLQMALKTAYQRNDLQHLYIFI